MPKGQPEAVPQDGLTTRQRRNRPLLIIHTGDGKGKSTAAFGLALRGWNQGWSVGVFQFVKSAKWRIGEQQHQGSPLRVACAFAQHQVGCDREALGQRRAAAGGDVGQASLRQLDTPGGRQDHLCPVACERHHRHLVAALVGVQQQ